MATDAAQNDVVSVTTKPDLNKDPSKIAASDCEVSKSTVAAVVSAAGKSGGDAAPVSDIQKKMRRAERFGMAVQLSEEEKRNSRAERFGTAPMSQGSEVSKTPEEMKRKARAERFGIPLPATPADEEVKKKARLARFGADAKTGSVEEDKRKARALRFSKPLSSSSSQIGGNGNIEQDAAIAGEAV